LKEQEHKTVRSKESRNPAKAKGFCMNMNMKSYPLFFRVRPMTVAKTIIGTILEKG
jgi:hypothetical protein